MGSGRWVDFDEIEQAQEQQGLVRGDAASAGLGGVEVGELAEPEGTLWVRHERKKAGREGDGNREWREMTRMGRV